MDWIPTIVAHSDHWKQLWKSFQNSSLLQLHVPRTSSLRNRKKFEVFLKIVLVAVFAFKPASVESSIACEEADDVYKTVLSNWPFAVTCDYLRGVWRNRHPSGPTSNDRFACKIARDGQDIGAQLLKEAHLNDSGQYHLQLMVNETTCIAHSTIVDVQLFSQRTCQQVVDTSAIHKEETQFGAVELPCQPVGDFREIIPSGADPDKFSTYWTMNCGSDDGILYTQNRTVHQRENPGYPKSLLIADIDFVNAGKLTCSVTWGGRKRYIVTYSLCVKRRPSIDYPTIECPGGKKIKSGERTVLDCYCRLPTGITEDGNFRIEWKKDGKVVCQTRYFNRTTPGLEDERFTCFAESNNDSLICETSGDIPSQPSTKTVKIEMALRGAVSPGSIEVVLYFNNRTYSDNITLMEDLIPVYKRLTTVLSVLLVLLFAGVTMFVIYKKNKLFFVLLRIEIYGRYNSAGEKLFVSHLFLNYQPEEERNAITRIFQTATTTVTQFFDVAEQQGTPQGSHQQNMEDGIEQCHSSLLVISNSYLDSEQSRDEAELAFNRLMERRSRVILVMLPEGKRKLKKEAATDDVWEKIFTLSKVFGNFTWRPAANDGENETALRRYITNRLPRARILRQNT